MSLSWRPESAQAMVWWVLRDAAEAGMTTRYIRWALPALSHRAVENALIALRKGRWIDQDCKGAPWALVDQAKLAPISGGVDQAFIPRLTTVDAAIATLRLSDTPLSEQQLATAVGVKVEQMEQHLQGALTSGLLDCDHSTYFRYQISAAAQTVLTWREQRVRYRETAAKPLPVGAGDGFACAVQRDGSLVITSSGHVVQLPASHAKLLRQHLAGAS